MPMYMCKSEDCVCVGVRLCGDVEMSVSNEIFVFVDFASLMFYYFSVFLMSRLLSVKKQNSVETFVYSQAIGMVFL